MTGQKVKQVLNISSDLEDMKYFINKYEQTPTDEHLSQMCMLMDCFALAHRKI